MSDPLMDVTARWEYTGREIQMLRREFTARAPERVRSVADYCLAKFESKDRPTVGKIRMYLTDGLPPSRDTTPSRTVTTPPEDRSGSDLSRAEANLCWKFFATLHAAKSNVHRARIVARYMEASTEAGHKWSERTREIYFNLYRQYARGDGEGHRDGNTHHIPDAQADA